MKNKLRTNSRIIGGKEKEFLLAANFPVCERGTQWSSRECVSDSRERRVEWLVGLLLEEESQARAKKGQG